MARLYLPLDVMFFDDEKIVAVGERPAWLYLAMCCKAKQLGTGGYLTEQQVVKLAVPGWKARLRPLLTEQLVKVADGRYFIPAWSNWNDTAEQVAERRRKDRERKAIPRGIQPESSRNPNGLRSDSLLVKGSEVFPPNPPASRGAQGCARHDEPHPNCRGCGTNARSVQKAAKLAAVPDWCGTCDEDTRLVELDDDRVARCRRCNPSVVVSA